MLPFGLHKNKKNWRAVSGFFLLLLVVGFVIPHFVHADLGTIIDCATSPFSCTVNSILYAIFTVIGWFGSIAVTIFGWAVDPGVYGVGGLFNKASIYAMWKFIRDFLNLFFILVLLYTAFTIVFQVASNYKKTLLSIVLAALFVNFSFPLTRVMIDAGNVPMYYFINLMMGPENNSVEAAKGSLGTVLSASKIQAVLMPKFEPGGDFSRLIVAIIFLFLFSMALLTLAVLLVVRLAALLLLVVFSPIGFAASIIPGMKKYSGMWWDKLTQYVLFGPAAMLMLYITTRFFEEIGKDSTLQKIKETTQANVVAGQSDFFASSVMFSITIIMLWMTIGIANSFSIAGAGAVTGAAQKFSKWAGKKTTGGVTYPARKFASGVGQGTKARFETSKVGRWFASPSRLESWGKGAAKGVGAKDGLIGGAKKAHATELQKFTDKKIHEQTTKDKENKLSRNDALNRLSSTDDIMRISAATSLANMDNGIQSMDDLTKALDALKDIDPATGKERGTYTERAVEIVAKADKKIIADNPATGTTGLQNLQTVIGSLGTNQKAVNDLIAKLDDSAFSGSGVDYLAVETAVRTVNASLVGALDAKVRKEGQAKVLVDAQVAGGASVSAAVQGVLGSMKSIKDLVNARTLFQDPGYRADAVTYVTTQPAVRYQEIKKAAAQESPSVFALI